MGTHRNRTGWWLRRLAVVLAALTVFVTAAGTALYLYYQNRISHLACHFRRVTNARQAFADR